MKKYAVAEDKKKTVRFDILKDANEYFMKRKSKTHELMMLLKFENGKWHGVRRN